MGTALKAAEKIALGKMAWGAGLVTGHDFSRAANGAKRGWALAPGFSIAYVTAAAKAEILIGLNRRD
jgi:hypothetical protein